MTIEEMREKKRELGYSYEQIAELAHLPIGTVQKVLGGITKSPRYDTLQALEEVFAPTGTNMIQEGQAEYYVEKKQGEYTVEDYLALPEDARVELIDGVLYDLAAPLDIHQLIGGKIFYKFLNYITEKKGTCIPAFAPFDVQLDCDNKTMVQPDVIIVCDRSKFQKGRIFGAPDLVVEILSPSTARRDCFKKMGKYEAAGVRECWLVDPVKKRVIVHDLRTEDCMTSIYTFDDEVPVNIFDGECKVDFREIYEYISFLYEREEP